MPAGRHYEIDIFAKSSGFTSGVHRCGLPDWHEFGQPNIADTYDGH